MNSIYQPMATQSNTNKVTSIVRDNFATNANRELVTDKATLIASLNNTNNSNSSMNNSHLYQNIHHVTSKAPTNGSNNNNNNTNTNNGSVNGQKVIAPNANNITNTANSVNNPSPIKNSNANSTANSSKQRNLDGYVGFANLPNQVYRKSVKKGFEFNLMVIGESGLGKSTFINSLFLTELYNPADFPGTFERKKKTTFVDATSVVLTEKGVNLRLTIVDTPGFGDSIDNTNCWSPIIDYIDSKYEEYLNAESKVNRKLPINDQRIHCCLYFISPGHT
jgi:septin 7